MKTTLLTLVTLLVCLLFSEATIAQTKMTSAPAAIQDSKVETSSLKPENGIPASFATQKELDATVPVKIAKLQEMILSGQYDDVRIQYLREEIWRFENAVVAKK